MGASGKQGRAERSVPALMKDESTCEVHVSRASIVYGNLTPEGLQVITNQLRRIVTSLATPVQTFGSKRCVGSRRGWMGESTEHFSECG